MRTRLLTVAIAVLMPLAAAHAAGLVVTKSSTVVADNVSLANPKALPGATIDYSILVNNPNGLLSGNVVNGVVITDLIPANVKFRVDAYPGASGPIELADGSLLGTGLLGSNVTLSYKGLTDATDGVEFYDGTNWTYQPVSTGGYDAKIRGVRVKLTGNQAATSTFRLRFRVLLQ